MVFKRLLDQRCYKYLNRFYTELATFLENVYNKNKTKTTYLAQGSLPSLQFIWQQPSWPRTSSPWTCRARWPSPPGWGQGSPGSTLLDYSLVVTLVLGRHKHHIAGVALYDHVQSLGVGGWPVVRQGNILGLFMVMPSEGATLVREVMKSLVPALSLVAQTMANLVQD